MRDTCIRCGCPGVYGGICGFCRREDLEQERDEGEEMDAEMCSHGVAFDEECGGCDEDDRADRLYHEKQDRIAEEGA